MTRVMSAFAQSLSDGFALRVLRCVLFAVFAALLFGLYAHSRFRGLVEPEAMEYAQLARNVHEGRGFTTRCVRPLDFRQLSKDAPWMYGETTVFDTRKAPLFPLVLAGGFRAIRPSFAVDAAGSVFEPETRVIVPICVLFALLTGLLLYRLALFLFDERVAIIAVLVYFVSETVLAQGISGLPTSLVSFCVTGASYAALVSGSRMSEGMSARHWFPPFLIAALLCALGVMAGYLVALLVPALALFLARGLDRGRVVAVTGFVLVVALGALPWLAKNRAVSGEWFGTAPYEALHDTALYEGDSLDRTLDPEFDPASVAASLRGKVLSGLSRMVEGNLRGLGNGLVVCLFLVSFFAGFGNDAVDAFRWYLAMALLLSLGAGALGDGGARPLVAYLPLVILLGTGFLAGPLGVAMGDPARREVSLWALVVLSGLTTVATVMGPRARVPYPPYYPPLAAHVSGLLDERETLCTDIPWATAWYGNRLSILLPERVDDLLTISRRIVPVSGVYLTSETADRRYVRDLVAGRFRSWLPILQRKVPEDFPFQHGIDLPPGTRDQLFLVDRPRWEAD